MLLCQKHARRRNKSKLRELTGAWLKAVMRKSTCSSMPKTSPTQKPTYKTRPTSTKKTQTYASSVPTQCSLLIIKLIITSICTHSLPSSLHSISFDYSLTVPCSIGTSIIVQLNKIPHNFKRQKITFYFIFD